MGTVLPEGWEQVCTKGHQSDHSIKCSNWICPQGRRYKDWSEVQIYFQLQNMEEDIPGVECRAENAKRKQEPDDEEVTLEEATKKEMDEKMNSIKTVKRKRPLASQKESSDSEEDVESRKKNRKGKKQEDKDYEPDNEAKLIADDGSKKSPKKTRRSVKPENRSSQNSVKVEEKATLDENTVIEGKEASNRRQSNSVESVTTNSSNSQVASKKSVTEGNKGVTMVGNSKITKVSEVIDLDSTPVNSSPAIKASVTKIDESKIIKDGSRTVSKEDSSLKQITPKPNDSRYEIFSEYCKKIKEDPVKASANVIDQFISKLHREKNLGKSVLSGYKSAILKIQAEMMIQKTNDKKPAIHVPASDQSQSTPRVTRASVKIVDAPSPSGVQAANVKVISSSTPQTQPKQNPQSVTAPKAQAAVNSSKQNSTESVSKPTQKQPNPQANRQGTPQTKPIQTNAQANAATPQTNLRQATPTLNPRQSSTPQSRPNLRQGTPQSNPRLTTPQSKPRQNTPQSNPRPNTPQLIAQARQTVGTPQNDSKTRSQGVVLNRAPTPRQQTPQIRGIQPNSQQKQQGNTPLANKSQGTPNQVRGTRPQAPTSVAQPRQQQPQVRQQLAKNVNQPQQQKQQPQFSELPSFLKGLVNFSCKLENNAGGGPSLYRAAAQHAGVGQDGWQEIRKYCHSKLLEWFQWYEPYYTFPLQVKLRIRNQTVQKTIPTSAEFQKFLKSEESLYSFYMSECELYCLANILGVPIYQLTYNIVGMSGRPEERCRWDTLDPHHGLVHKNKFANNKDPLYLLYEDKVHFSKIKQLK